MQGRDSHLLDPATSIQVGTKISFLSYFTGFEEWYSISDCLKCHFSILFSEEMVGFLTFFLYVSHF